MDNYTYTIFHVLALWPIWVLVWMVLCALPVAFLKRTINITLALVVAFTCHFFWHSNCLEANFEKLHLGMSKSDAIRLMGLPKAVSSDDVWSYEFYFARWLIEFDRNGRLGFAKRDLPANKPASIPDYGVDRP